MHFVMCIQSEDVCGVTPVTLGGPLKGLTLSEQGEETMTVFVCRTGLLLT
jgi:hypothetical protein